jgi:hypothetical protein
MSNSELYLLGQVVLGYAMQWARSFKNVPNWLSWGLFGIASALVFIWVTPDFFTHFKADWRTVLAALVSFILATRGGAATSKEAKIAPETNSN